jgi:hypothetical protein
MRVLLLSLLVTTLAMGCGEDAKARDLDGGASGPAFGRTSAMTPMDRS